MFATDARADVRHPVPAASPAGRCGETEPVEEDVLAPARGIVLGAVLGTASLVVLGVAGWLLL